MTCRAILHRDGQEHIPALLVRTGKLSARQCDHEYKGEKGDCPTCKALLDGTDFSDGGSFALAMAGKDPVVVYRSASYGDGGTEPWRIPGFAHPGGYWGEMRCGDCSNPDRETHRVNLSAIKHFYEQQFPGCRVLMEERLRAPGDPPRHYSPDLSVRGADGERLVAVEYQRSHESYDKFAERDDLRRSEDWKMVDWWFDDTQPHPPKQKRTVYERSDMHRTHLALMEVPFYRCWVDHVTYLMHAEYGRSGELPPNRRRRVEKHIEKAELKDCSIAAAMQALEGEPEEKLIQDVRQPIRAIAAQGVAMDVAPFADLQHMLKREHAVAQAAVLRQKRLDEQDRQHREFSEKIRLLHAIGEAAYAVSVLEEAKTDAGSNWSIDQLEEELSRLEGLTEKAHQRREELAVAKRLAGEEGRNKHQAFLLQQQEEKEDKERLQWENRWGVPVGTTGVGVRWQVGKSFIGVIDSWTRGRPVIRGNRGQVQWASSPADYSVLGDPKGVAA